MAVGLVVDYMVHIVHYFLHQVQEGASVSQHLVLLRSVSSRMMPPLTLSPCSYCQKICRRHSLPLTTLLEPGRAARTPSRR